MSHYDPALSADALKLAFLAHVDHSGSPESFPGLNFDRPDFAHRHEIVTPFEVAPKWRETTERVRCALCSHGHPKFWSGYLIRNCVDGTIRLIGRVCGSNSENFGASTFRAMEEERVQRERERQAGNFLLARLKLVAIMRQELAPLVQTVDQLRRHRLRLKKMAPELMAQLSSAVRIDGRLMVETRPEVQSAAIREIIRAATGGNRSDVVQETVAVLIGSEFIEDTRPHHVFIGEASDALRQLDFGEEWIETLFEMDAARMIAAWESYEEAIRAVIRVHDYATRAARFWTAENFDGLNRWGRNSGCPINVRFVNRVNNVLVEIGGRRVTDFDIGDALVVPKLCEHWSV